MSKLLVVVIALACANLAACTSIGDNTWMSRTLAHTGSSAKDTSDVPARIEVSSGVPIGTQSK